MFILRIVFTIMVVYYLPLTIFTFIVALVGIVGLSLLSHYEGYCQAFEDMKKEKVKQ